VKGTTKAPRQPSFTARSSSAAAASGSPSDRCAIGISRPPEPRQKSAAYAGITWFVLAPSRPLPRRGLETIVICVASYALALGVRAMISDTGAQNWWALPHNIETLWLSIRSFGIVGWLGVLVGVTLFLSACVDFSTPLATRFVALALLFAVPGLLFGWFEDVRVFLPCFVMACFAVAAGKEA
jgi:hypothetical protein